MNRMAVNAALVLAVIGLGSTLLLTQKKKEEKGAPLTTLSADAVTSIAIEHPGQPTVKLQKDGMLWKLVEPVQAATDPFEVATLVNLATQETRRTLKSSDVQLADLKLEPAQFSITLNDQKLDFGDLEPLEYRRYVKHGDSVALIDDPSGTAVDADYSDLVAKELLPGSADLQKVEVPGLMVASVSGKWVATPTPAVLSTDSFVAFFDAWKRARAMWNAAMPADGGKGEPITLTYDGGVVHLVLVSRDPQLVIDRPDLKIRYTLSKADADKLLQLALPPKPDAAPNAAAPVGNDVVEPLPEPAAKP